MLCIMQGIFYALFFDLPFVCEFINLKEVQNN